MKILNVFGALDGRHLDAALFRSGQTVSSRRRRAGGIVVGDDGVRAEDGDTADEDRTVARPGADPEA